ncbi:MAG: hypothetical protein ACE5HZ_06645 [Fidelibacterota bacterium]
MKAKTVLAISAALLWLSACSDRGVTNPNLPSDPMVTAGTLPGIVSRHRLAAEILFAPNGTYYKCGSEDVTEAKEGDVLYGGCSIWNEKQRAYTLEAKGPHDYILLSAGEVHVSDPDGIYYRLGKDRWIEITEDGSVACDVVRIRGNGAGDLSTYVQLDIHSGFNEN